MTRWVTWLLAWLAVIGLLWNLRGQAGDISRVTSSASVWSHTVLRAFGVILSTSPPYIQTHAEALEASALPRACLLAGDGGPPWLDLRGPPGAYGIPWVSDPAAGDAGRSTATPRTFSPGIPRPEEAPRGDRSFATAFN